MPWQPSLALEEDGDPAVDPVDLERLLGQPTPVQRAGAIWLKRDDLYSVYGAPGGKARTCLSILGRAPRGGVAVTASSRHSPQAIIVARIARGLRLTSRIHTPGGPETPELGLARLAGGKRVEHTPGYNSVIVARARADAANDPRAIEVPFGMDCGAAVQQTAAALRASDWPSQVKRVVVPVGSGMTLAGVLAGMHALGRHVPVVGVQVGADPTARLDTYWPGWRNQCALVVAPERYDEHVQATIGRVLLDPVYEAKCLPFLQPGDLFWIVGIRANLVDQAAALRRAGLPQPEDKIVTD